MSLMTYHLVGLRVWCVRHSLRETDHEPPRTRHCSHPSPYLLVVFDPLGLLCLLFGSNNLSLQPAFLDWNSWLQYVCGTSNAPDVEERRHSRPGNVETGTGSVLMYSGLLRSLIAACIKALRSHAYEDNKLDGSRFSWSLHWRLCNSRQPI